MVNYAKIKVEELKKLLQDFGIPAEVVNELKKEELVQLHKENAPSYLLDEVDLENDFEEIMSSETEDDIVTDDEPDIPAITSPEWSDYVMTHFEKNELIDGNPICAGLRRVAELLLGDIVESGPTQVFASEDASGPGRATVVYRVVFNWLNSGEFRNFADAADVWHGNTDDLFCAHPVATASTRAEGRALRKALKLRALAAEELAKKDIVSIVQKAVATNADWDPTDTISNAQVGFINTKCKQLDVDVRKFVNQGSGEYESIYEISKDTARKMLKTLNDYQTQDMVIPAEVKNFVSDWRD